MPFQCGPLNISMDYPFAVEGLPRPHYCSSSGYRLFCINTTTLVIYMSSGGPFFYVTGVDYVNHVLTVVDTSLAHQTCPHGYRNTGHHRRCRVRVHRPGPVPDGLRQLHW
jgi:hypothetical protein